MYKKIIYMGTKIKKKKKRKCSITILFVRQPTFSTQDWGNLKSENYLQSAEESERFKLHRKGHLLSISELLGFRSAVPTPATFHSCD